MIKIIFLISLGGFFGAPSRYLFTQLINKLLIFNFPFGTLLINIVGSFFIGFFVAGLKNYFTLDEIFIKYFVMIGFLGSFTTFSAFSLETINMINEGLLLYSFLYIILTLILNILAVYIGINFFRWISIKIF